MADLVITASNVVLISGATSTHDAAEAVTAGEWIYKASDTTVGVASNDNAAKATVAGLALNSAATGQPVTYAKDGAEVTIGATATLLVWYVLSASGATSPVADQATNDYGSLVGYGSSGTAIKINIVNTGEQAP